MASVWGELKRRNVVRVGIAYAIVAWLLLQVADVVLDNIGSPAWVFQVILLLLVIGFPVAIIFAWAFELTPEGIKKEKNVDRNESITHLTGRKLDFTIIGVLAVAVVYFVSDKIFWTDDVVTESPVETSIGAIAEVAKTIAVLPFVNMSGDVDQEYFSDGITEEILNALAGIRELAVTSRTSAFAFKGKSLSIPQIAKELGVAHILEGSVRRSGNQLRITAQLIEVESDKHLWSESYDRELTDIFAVQDEISENIAAALKVNLLGVPVVHPDSRGVNAEAYDVYLRGLQQKAISTFESLANAERHFEQSIAIDPLFVRAYAGLGWSYEEQSTQGSVSIDDNLPKIRDVVRRGLEIDPDNAGLIGLAAQLAFRDGDLEQAELGFRRAITLDPPHFSVWNKYADFLWSEGRAAEALQMQTDWLDADPLNPEANVAIAFAHQFRGNFEKLFATTSRLRTIAPNNPYGPFIDGLTRIYYVGDLVAGILDFERGMQIDPNDHEVICMLAIAYFSIGELALADAWIEKGRQIAPQATFVQAADVYGMLLRGDIASAKEISLKALADHRQFDRWWGGFITMRFAIDELIDRGEPGQAVDMILQAEPEGALFRNNSPSVAPHLSANPGQYGVGPRINDYLPDFARVLRAAGDETGADNVLAHVEANQNWRREHGLTVSETHAAEVHALRGRADDALIALERAEQNGTIYAFWQYRLIHNRIFDDIRDDPRFTALVERVNAEMQRQRTEYNNNGSGRNETADA
jgi:TolB-like protein/Tfp pilus assembly protein PilF